MRTPLQCGVALAELGAETGISEVDLRAVVRKRMASLKALHEAKK